jgi:hypothetical protein
MNIECQMLKEKYRHSIFVFFIPIFTSTFFIGHSTFDIYFGHTTFDIALSVFITLAGF